MVVGSDFEDLLRIYYQRLFPYENYIKWIGAGNVEKNYLSRREFSFTLADDIYLRYLSFTSADELKAEMVKRLPHKIDIGAVFNAKPSDHLKIRDFQPVEKELVFDIDMTDYDDIRTCCSGANICGRCWRFMTVALKILDRALREDFGFKHLLWVYSGRRGIHCWVSDPSAKALGQAARSAVAEYLQVLSGGDSKAKKVYLRSQQNHPAIDKALDIIKQNFSKLCLEDQDILGTKERCAKVLQLIPNEELRSEIEKEFESHSTSVKRWNAMNEKISRYVANNGTRLKNVKEEKLLSEIMLQYAYPRLDINVSKGLNHLLKSPFCVHPKTGRVCIPIDPTKADNFDPMKVPTLSQLTDEIDKFGKEESNKIVSKDFKKTSLREPMKVFDEFLSKLSETWRGKRMEMSDSKMEF